MTLSLEAQTMQVGNYRFPMKSKQRVSYLHEYERIGRNFVSKGLICSVKNHYKNSFSVQNIRTVSTFLVCVNDIICDNQNLYSYSILKESNKFYCSDPKTAQSK